MFSYLFGTSSQTESDVSYVEVYDQTIGMLIIYQLC